MKFYPRYLGDFKKKTGSLSLLEKGVYNELLDWCYANEQPLPANTARIWAIVGALSEPEKRAVDTVLTMFFKKNGVGWEHERVNEEIAKWRVKSTTAKANINKRWHKP